MNHMNTLLFLLVNTLCIHGMDDHQKKSSNLLNEKIEKTTTQPIPIPSKHTGTSKKDSYKSRMIYLDISPSSPLWTLGLDNRNSPSNASEKRSPGTSLR